jgi:hypothetical protein
MRECETEDGGDQDSGRRSAGYLPAAQKPTRDGRWQLLPRDAGAGQPV